MKIVKRTFCLILLLVASKEVGYAQSSRKKILQLIQTVPHISVAEPGTNVIVPRQSIGFEGEGSNRAETFEEKDHLTNTIEELVAFNPSSAALFPGSLIQGKSLETGVLTAITTTRTPLEITVTDLRKNNPNAKYSAKVINPSLATTTNAIHKIVSSNVSSNQPARLTYTKVQMNSVEEGMLRLGASAKWLSGNVSGSFQSSSTYTKSKLMVRFVQSYYTVSCESPSSPTSYFANTASYNDLRLYIGPSNPATYVSSVTYGREYWMLVESNHSYEETRDALDAAFSGGLGSGTINFNANNKKVLDESNIQLLAIGGSGSSAIKPISDVSGLSTYFAEGANYSTTSPGVIISYVVRYLDDNSVARISSYADYTIKTSLAHPEKVITGLQFNFDTGNDDKDDDNHVGIRFVLLPKNIVLYENGDLPPHQPNDRDPTWHDDSPVNVDIRSISQKVLEHDPLGKQIRIDVWKSGGAHWHFGYHCYVVMEDGTKIEIHHEDSNRFNFGDKYNSDSWTYNIPW